MRTLHTALLAGVAALALGVAGSASAQNSQPSGTQTHVMTVRLPDGGIGQVRYVGDVPPQIVFDNAASAPMRSFFPSSFFGGSPFAMLDQISAEMDRQAATMFRQADAMAAMAQSGTQPTEAAMRALPPGSENYTFVSTLSGNGVCSRSVEITSQGNGAAPKVVSHSSGSCGATASAGGPINPSGNLPTATAPVAPRPDVVWTSAHGAHPAAGLVHEIPPAQR
ncbi:MAG TPA: hypothetical protein VHY35_20450 [Stellaceae bacterium]|nr:hypothetical protein [Stellaceae bacterium]